MLKSKIGDERFRLEHISYKHWCKMAEERGWNGEDGNDGLRDYCEPEEAASYTCFSNLEQAVKAAKTIFERNPDDSAFGAIIIDHQEFQAAHDDSGNLISSCRPEWETIKIYEITSGGDILECS